MGAVTSCSVCHFSTRSVEEKSPRPQDAITSLGNRRCVSDGLVRVKSRQ